MKLVDRYSRMKDLEDLLICAAQMRSHQRAYFVQRNRDYLFKAKQAEEELDKRIKALMAEIKEITNDRVATD